MATTRSTLRPTSARRVIALMPHTANVLAAKWHPPRCERCRCSAKINRAQSPRLIIGAVDILISSPARNISTSNLSIQVTPRIILTGLVHDVDNALHGHLAPRVRFFVDRNTHPWITQQIAPDHRRFAGREEQPLLPFDEPQRHNPRHSIIVDGGNASEVSGLIEQSGDFISRETGHQRMMSRRQCQPLPTPDPNIDAVTSNNLSEE